MHHHAVIDGRHVRICQMADYIPDAADPDAGDPIDHRLRRRVSRLPGEGTKSTRNVGVSTSAVVMGTNVTRP